MTRRFRDRVRARWDVSIAEVGGQDLHQKAVFGVAVISGEASLCDSLLAEIAGAAALQEDAVLTDRATELIPIGDDMFGFGEDSEEEDDGE